MSIKFNVVTWYSKLLSIIFFIAVLPILTFYIGKQYQLTLDTQNVQFTSSLPVILKKDRNIPKINVGASTLEGSVFGKIQNIYEKDGRLWVNIDPADQVSTLECVFRAYDVGSSQDCESSGNDIVWNISTSTISMPLSAKAILAVYYNDGSKINLKPKVINSKNGKLYSFSLATSSVTRATSTLATSSTSTALSLSELANLYNRILSYDGDDTYRWNPLMYIDIKTVKTGNASSSKSESISEVVSVEEVWKP
ncbi:MAG: hypothetical protein K9M11_03075 [Candidatus Pacebacteria bacterium]|nr:hypothetical protein [Candidatus Paceibacterota bacterium]